jgi:two-component system, OmpR family, response regulator
MHPIEEDDTDEVALTPEVPALTPEADSNTSLASEKPAPVKMRVLCVDDNWDAADSLGEMLAIAGHEVVVRHNGAAALEAVAEGFRPDVCILDISMPGINGYQLATALRAARGEDDLLLVAVTALNDYRSLERMAASGFDLQFTKPVYPQELCAAINHRARQLATTARQ